MSVITRAQESRQLQEGLNAVFGTNYRRYPDEWKGIFNVGNSKKAYEEDVLFAGTGRNDEGRSHDWYVEPSVRGKNG